MSYSLICALPVRKRNYRFTTVERSIEITSAVVIAQENLGYVMEELARVKSTVMRAYRNPPPFLLFKIMYLTNPRLGHNHKVGEFRIWLESGEVEITVPWL
jgi:hypothetical protein